jgi:hypothetical protein
MLLSVLSADECKAVASLYLEESIFRSHVVMGRHGFGRGEYKYFSYPLLPIIHGLRTTLYAQLAPVANRWNEAMGIEVRYPESHSDFAQRCHDAGQSRPTPLLLQYGPGDYNCLHQDFYGEHVFPIQVAILLSEPKRDFTGGEVVLTEQRPRMQSRPEVVPLRQADVKRGHPRYQGNYPADEVRKDLGGWSPPRRGSWHPANALRKISV